VARRNVQLGPLEAGLRVVREGIAAEDWVVVRGLQRARPGIKVDMKQTSIALSPVSPVNKTAE
jgi:multidrug efflux system membrane fusion protein